MSTRAGRRWAVVAAASGTVLIAAGAFWLSFVALADLAVRSGIVAGQAWIWPLLVDGLIVVATVAVVALDGHRAAWYPWTLLIAGAGMSVTANAAHALVAAEATVPGVLASTVAAVPPLVLLASTHLTVVLTRPTTTPAPDVAAAAREPSPRSEAIDTAHEETPETPERAEPRPSPAAPEDGQAPAALTPAPPTAPALESEPPEPAPPAPAPAASVPGWGGPPRGEGVTGRRERAEALRAAGWSNKQIARELGVHASTVGRWLPRPDPPAALAAGKTDDDTTKEKES